MYTRVQDAHHRSVSARFALSRGLTEAMGGTLIPETTPGGGLTMRLAFATADTPAYVTDPP